MNDYPIAISPSRAMMTARPFVTTEQTDFLSQLATRLHVAPADAAALASLQLFTGPAGQACRLHLHHGEAAVQPEALLPVSAAELEGVQTRQLMLAHDTVLNEFGWQLGVSPEGLLQLSCLSWIDSLDDAATAFDLASGVATAVMHSLELARHDSDGSSDDAWKPS